MHQIRRVVLNSGYNHFSREGIQVLSCMTYHSMRWHCFRLAEPFHRHFRMRVPKIIPNITRHRHKHMITDNTVISQKLLRDTSMELTFPAGNFFRNASDLLVSPNVKSGATDSATPEYCAAINAL